jgi:hypothetical protein
VIAGPEEKLLDFIFDEGMLAVGCGAGGRNLNEF